MRSTNGDDEIRDPAFWAPIVLLTSALGFVAWTVINAVNDSPTDIFILGYGKPIAIGGVCLLFLVGYFQIVTD